MTSYYCWSKASEPGLSISTISKRFADVRGQPRHRDRISPRQLVHSEQDTVDKDAVTDLTLRNFHASKLSRWLAEEDAEMEDEAEVRFVFTMDST